MPTPLLLALALIQGPTAAPQDQQLAMLSSEPILATGIKVQVVKTSGATGEAEPLPVSSRRFAGVTMDASPCARLSRALRYTLNCAVGASLGWDYQELVAYRTNWAQLDELRLNRGYQQGQAMAKQKAAKTRSAANPPSGGQGGGYSYSAYSSSNTSGASGGGRSSGGGGSQGPVGSGARAEGKPGNGPQ